MRSKEDVVNFSTVILGNITAICSTDQSAAQNGFKRLKKIVLFPILHLFKVGGWRCVEQNG